MISEQKVITLVEEKIDGGRIFIVDVKVLPGNRINVLIDSPDGISVSDCVAISKFIESNFNRDEEDFELEVSSPGLDQPLKVYKQYLKNTGRQVQVVTKEGLKHSGTLVSVNESEIEVQESLKERIPGRKAKQTVIKNHQIQFNNIKETKVVIFFN